MVGKPCHRCGKDLSGLKRSKDSKGRYFCSDCAASRTPASLPGAAGSDLDAIAQAATATAATKPAKRRLKWISIAVAAVVITGVIVAPLAISLLSQKSEDFDWELRAHDKLIQRERNELEKDRARIAALKTEFATLKAKPKSTAGPLDTQSASDRFEIAMQVDPVARTILSRVPELTELVRTNERTALAAKSQDLVRVGRISLAEADRLRLFTIALHD
jgi:hypothetical protein